MELTEEEIIRIIQNGENQSVEFKETYRWNHHKNQKDRRNINNITRAICGFLNNNAGIVLIGVQDDGMIIGVEKDLEEFKSKDSFLQDLGRKIRKDISINTVRYVKAYFKQVNNREILIVSVEQANQPFIHLKKEFVVREMKKTQKIEKKKDIYKFFQENYNFSGSQERFEEYLYELMGYKKISEIIIQKNKSIYYPLTITIATLFISSGFSFFVSFNKGMLIFTIATLVSFLFLTRFSIDTNKIYKKQRNKKDTNIPPENQLNQNQIILIFSFSLLIILCCLIRILFLILNDSSLLLPLFGISIASFVEYIMVYKFYKKIMIKKSFIGN